jgi:hypothetical protein
MGFVRKDTEDSGRKEDEVEQHDGGVEICRQVGIAR